MCGEGCGREYGVSGEVCWRVGKGCREKNGGGVGKCVRVWGPNTLPPTLPHISLTSLPSPFPTSSLTSPTLQHTFLHLLSYLFPHFPFLPPHPNIFSYYLHISPHLLKVWQSYHVAKLLATTISTFFSSVFFGRTILKLIEKQKRLQGVRGPRKILKIYKL